MFPLFPLPDYAITKQAENLQIDAMDKLGSNVSVLSGQLWI